MVESNLYRPAVLEAPSYWSYLGIPESGAELVQSVRQGFDRSVLKRMAAVSGFTVGKLADMAGLSAYALRQAKQCGHWSSMQSDRLFRIAKVLNAVSDLFGGDWELARRWLLDHQKGLGGERPVDWLRTEVETRMVLDLIGRISHAVII